VHVDRRFGGQGHRCTSQFSIETYKFKEMSVLTRKRMGEKVAELKTQPFEDL